MPKDCAKSMTGDLQGIDAVDVSFSSLLKDKAPKLSLPKYQRDFVWDKAKIECLLDDLLLNKKTTGVNNMFAGSILTLQRPCPYEIDWSKHTIERVAKMRKPTCDRILSKANSAADTLEECRRIIEDLRPTSDIIDGQQRITTSYILCKMLLEKCEEFELNPLIKKLNNILLGAGKIRRLSLKPNDDQDLELIIKEHSSENQLPAKYKPKSGEADGSIKWSKRGNWAPNPMHAAYHTILKWINGKLEFQDTLQKKKNWITTYAKFFIDKFGFIIVTVKEEGQAHLVFRAMNSTGEGLTGGELIKSMLFYKSRSISGFNEDIGWSNISNILDSTRTGSTDIISQFFYDYGRSIGMKNKGKKTKLSSNARSVFEAFEQHCMNMSNTEFKQFFNSLKSEAENYHHIQFPPPSVVNWRDVPKERKNDLVDLRNMGYRQTRQVLLSARRYLDDQQFSRVIQVIITMIVRVNICFGVSPAKKEDDWAKWASKFNSEKSDYLPAFENEVTSYIKEFYPGKDTKTKMNNAFKKKLEIIRLNQNTAKHILRVVEGLEGNPWDSYDLAKIHAEHIFPKSARNPGPWFKHQTWSDPNKIEFIKNNLGNFILLEAPINNSFVRTRTWKIKGKNTKGKPKSKNNYGKYHGYKYHQWKLNPGENDKKGSDLVAVQNFYKRYEDDEQWTESMIIERAKSLSKKAVSKGHWWFDVSND